MKLDVKSKSPLNWEVFVTPGIPVATSDVPPGQKQRTYSPISSTLIYGKRDAVLVDTFLTVKQSDDLMVIRLCRETSSRSLRVART